MLHGPQMTRGLTSGDVPGTKTAGNTDRGLSPHPGSVVVAGRARDNHQEADMPGFNSIGWFEIGTDDPAGAEKFYGEVFGWSTRRDDGDQAGYLEITTGNDDGPGLHAGGLYDTGGALPGYAVFGVLVEDVAETCRRVRAAGGSVRRDPQVTPAGITFAHLLDPQGNQFEVFAVPPGGE